MPIVVIASYIRWTIGKFLPRWVLTYLTPILYTDLERKNHIFKKIF
jgi:hypothetical protein